MTQSSSEAGATRREMLAPAALLSWSYAPRARTAARRMAAPSRPLSAGRKSGRAA